MRFEFRLEAPLRLARHREDESRRALGRAVGILERLRRRLESLEEELSGQISSQAAPRQGEIWIQGQTLYLDWVQGRRSEIASARNSCCEAEKGVRSAQADLVEKRRAREVLDRLKARRFAQWKREQSRRELAESSDIAGRRWAAARKFAEAS